MPTSRLSKSSDARSASPPGLAAVLPPEACRETGQFVGRWNQLVSTTNWEKGRIICQWRQALEQDGAPQTDYSDETWAQLVGGVTSQHVGRLRRVSQRFDEAHDQYQGLYWSHFQAALDWEDAEMWLEGAVQNAWSISQMRGKRWETVGTPGELPPEDAEREEMGGEGMEVIASSTAVAPQPATTESGEAAKKTPKSNAHSDDASEDEGGIEAEAIDTETSEATPQAAPRRRLSVEVDDLPSDVAEAFEQFKLAIIAHRREDWSATTPQAIIECLDALKELVLA